jgi:tyrosine-protein kinase Etk/Wzc
VNNQIPDAQPSPLAPTADEINFREIFDIAWSGKWFIAAIAVSFTVLSLIYAFSAEPLYQSSGLVQVEQEKTGLSASINELSSLIGSAPAEASAEIAILKSRMVLGAVVDSLKLYIRVQPNYFPLIGKPIARRRANATSLPDLADWLRKYAWGGEVINVTAFDVPVKLNDRRFIIETREKGFALLDQNDQVIIEGAVGQRYTAALPAGPISIFVQELHAAPGTQFSIAHLSPPAILNEVAGSVTISEQPRDSGVLAVQVRAATPDFAAQLLNAILDAYLKQNVERKSAQAEQSLEFLKGQLPELKEQVDAAQAHLNSYQLKKGTVDVQQETQLVLQRAVELETQRLTLGQEREAALQRYTSQHPVVVTLSEQIRGIEREQATIKKQVENLPETQQEILSLMRDLEVNTQLYTALLNSAQELQVTKAGTVGNVRIIDYGLVPLRPIKPNKSNIVGLGVLLGLVSGVVGVFALRSLLKGVDKPEDVERVTGLPTYAAIPYSQAQQGIVRRLRGDSTSGKVLAGLDGDDLAIEALRSLRTSLHFAMLEATNNIVMFTGPIAALGKSFVSINLGAVLAMSGKRVLVVDADLRRGRLHYYLNVDQSPGVSDLVSGTVASADSIIHKTHIEGLFFAAGGTRPPNPSEVLMSERFDDFMKLVSSQFDYVLVDTPPVLPVTDAAVVGRLAGTTLLVLKSAEHPMRAIEETVKRLRQAGVQIRGTIFNQVGARIGSYGYGSYGYNYGYSGYGYKTSN